MSSFGSKVTDGTVTWTICKSLSVNGGYMMGNILYDNRALSNTFVISGDVTSSKGAVLELLRESNNQTISSQWMLGSHWSESGTSKRCFLMGRKDNTLRWVRSDETQTNLSDAAIVVKSFGLNSYITYASGLIMQWGSNCLPTWDSTNTIITFPISFSYWNHYAITVLSNGFSTVTVDNTYHNASDVKLKHNSVSSSVNAVFEWIAIGY